MLTRTRNVENIPFQQAKHLTNRRLEYLAMVGFGFCNKEIASILCVSISTVKKTLEEIYKRLNAVDRANAILIACTHGLLSTDFCNELLLKYPNARVEYNSKQLKREAQLN